MDKVNFINKYSGGFYGDQSSLETKLANLAGFIFDGKYGAQVLATGDTTLTQDDSGKTFNIGTDGKTFTLPEITADNVGKMKFRIRNIGGDGTVGITISPNAKDGINGSCPTGTGSNADANTADSLVSKASGEVDKNLVNTKSTANAGDWLELEAVALTKWFITGGVGVWASES